MLLENQNINTKPSQLLEIKRGQTGYGILIESDGYISRDLTDNNKKIIKEAFESRQNGEWNVPNPFVLDVVMQKFGIENANKRIYPEHVLKREVEKYQQRIAERRALGECYTEDAECLTPKGWVSIVDIKEGDEVITLNVYTKEVESQKVLKKIHKISDKGLINIKGDNINDVVTRGHGYPVFHEYDGKIQLWDYFYAGELQLLFSDTMYEKAELLLPKNLNLTNKNDFIVLNNCTFESENDNVDVYCIEVPNHTWFVRQNGYEHWTKNCNHPAESVIDLGRISHNIVECHWEGHTLVGKIEFNLTEGFRRYGICSSLGDTCANLIMNGYKIGVSSRGIGSVENRLGKTIVQDDFEIICWDIVSDPSTPNAYIGNNKEELQAYIESTTKQGTSLNEKINKIKNILL